MKYSSLFFCFLITIVACNRGKKNEEIVIKPIAFKVIANQKLLNTSSLWVSHDSIFITTPLISNSPMIFLYYQSYMNSIDSTYVFRMVKIPENKIDKLIDQMNNKSLFKLEILSSKIEYSKISPHIQEILKNNKLESPENIYKYYDGKLVFSTQGNSKHFYVFDSLHNFIYQLKNPPANYGGYLDLKDFFLFDLNGDTIPEIFTISGRQVHDNEVSLDVLKILW